MKIGEMTVKLSQLLTLGAEQSFKVFDKRRLIAEVKFSG
jgi:hypothetical protein